MRRRQMRDSTEGNKGNEELQILIEQKAAKSAKERQKVT